MTSVRTPVCLLIAACGLAHASPRASAGSIDYSWIGTSSNWETTNWLHNGGQIAPAWPVDPAVHAAAIPGASALTITVSSANPATRLLEIANANALVRIINGGSLRVGSGGIIGPGKVTIDATSSGNVPAGLVLADESSAHLVNTVLTMIDLPGGQNRAVLTSGPTPINVAANAQIRGSGLFNAYIANAGLIAADRSGEPLTFAYDSTNAATMSALSGGILTFASGNVTNVGATISASGTNSTVLLSGGIITGGTLSTSNAGAIRTAPLTSSTLVQPTIAGRTFVSGNSNLTITGAAATIGASITLEGSNPTNLIFSPDNTAISGTGEIFMNAPAGSEDSVRISTGNNTISTASTFTIRGAGFLNAYLTSHGLIDADQPGRAILFRYLTTNNGTITATGGIIDIATQINQTQPGFPDGVIHAVSGTVALRANADISGGSLTRAGTGEFTVDTNVTLRDLALNAPLLIDNSGFLNLVGNVSNNAEITVGDGVNSATLGAVGVLNHTISGTGTVTLRAVPGSIGSAQLLSGANTIILGPNQVFRGTGYFNAYVQNQGRIAPGISNTPGEYRLDYTYTATSTSTIDLDLYGPAPTQQDRITGGAPIALAGTLKVRKAPGFIPPVNAEYDIITCGSRTGQFDVVDAPGFAPIYLPTGVRLIALATPCGGADFNGDGSVNTPDLTFFLARFGRYTPIGTPDAVCDFSRNEFIDTPDLVYFLARFGSACP